MPEGRGVSSPTSAKSARAAAAEGQTREPSMPAAALVACGGVSALRASRRVHQQRRAPLPVTATSRREAPTTLLGEAASLELGGRTIACPPMMEIWEDTDGVKPLTFCGFARLRSCPATRISNFFLHRHVTHHFMLVVQAWRTGSSCAGPEAVSPWTCSLPTRPGRTGGWTASSASTALVLRAVSATLLRSRQSQVLHAHAPKRPPPHSEKTCATLTPSVRMSIRVMPKRRLAPRLAQRGDFVATTKADTLVRRHFLSLLTENNCVPSSQRSGTPP